MQTEPWWLSGLECCLSHGFFLELKVEGSNLGTAVPFWSDNIRARTSKKLIRELIRELMRMRTRNLDFRFGARIRSPRRITS